MRDRPRGFDAVIVGSGATGSWAAKLLTEGGLSVLVLEAGPSVTTAEADQGDATDARRPIQSQCYAFDSATRHYFVDDIDHPYETPADKPFTWIRMRLVGGKTALWERVALRMSDRQFKAASLDGVGIDWPVTYTDLQPYYDAAERFLGVCGIMENFEEIPDGSFLPTRLGRTAQAFKQAVELEWPDRPVTATRRGSEWYAEPEGGSTHRERMEKGARQYPASSAGAALACAQSTTRLTLRVNSVVRSVICDGNGKRALGVEYVDGLSGTAHEVHAKVVVLCASTIETTRIMLNSTCPAHPDGVGNSNGLLGRYLTEHVSGVTTSGLRRGECNGPTDLYIPNFRNRNGNTEKFLRGYAIMASINPWPGKGMHCGMFIIGEMLPIATNYVELGRSRDRSGIPVPRIHCCWSDNEREMAQDQATQLKKILHQTGFDHVESRGLKLSGISIHEAGTARMGADPKTSILNGYNQCWGVPNLFVTDGAAFPSVGFQNPTLTMMAITGRACDYILGEFRRGAW
jgi:glucoside 3-dehydrogenase (cytochrome c) catalytic subunit